ncbi:myb family transcription factor PHL7-like [Salvia splendens]|uniref:myb family transcription factor PHL7-like n=1 Tax=Salvia splendens TaxID=180675 RepID=UPI001C27B65D|nr:myb family transcription factor PHL7-like [Salvia splendens]
MALRKSESGASSWVEAGSGGDGEPNEAAAGAVGAESEERRQDPAEAGSEEAPPGEDPPKEEEAAVADPSIFQLSYPRPRLRWTAELHEQFVKAIDELGGANRATPKLIHALMGVEGITLFHIKSHLQKYRLGKTGRRLWRKDLLPPNYFEGGDMVPPMNQLQAEEPSVQSAFNMNGINVLGDEALSDLHLMVEPQATFVTAPPPRPLPALGPLPAPPAPAPAPEPAINSVKYEDVVEPSLLPLFPAGGPTMEWPEFNQGGARRALDNPPTMDDYLNYSADFTNPSSCTLFNTFFDDVATLPPPNPDFFSPPPTFP